MSVEKALQALIESHQETVKALETLKDTVKNEGSRIIQQHVMEEQFDHVTHVVGELNKFTKLSYETNIENVVEFVEEVFGEMKMEQIREPRKELKAKATTNFFTEAKELEKEEEELLKEIGFQGASRLKELKTITNEEVLFKLEEKGLVMIEEFPWGSTTELMFELSTKGKRKFEKLFESPAVRSKKKEVSLKYDLPETGYFLNDVEKALEKKNYIVHECNDKMIEFEKNTRDFSYYLAPDLGGYSEQEYFKILDQRASKKSIGFVAADQKTLETKTKPAVEKWASLKKQKFMFIHLTTIEDLEEKSDPFLTLEY